MRPLSQDLKRRIVEAVDAGEGSRRELARRFAVDPSTITRLLRLRRETGSIEPRPHGGGMPAALDEAGHVRLGELVREAPDATLAQLRDRLGPRGRHIMTVARAPRKRRITRKKKTPRAAERDRPEVRRQRRGFRRRIAAIPAERLIFVDETGVTTAMTPAHGRAPRGERVAGTAPASWESRTVIAAIGERGVRAPLVVEGSVDAATFLAHAEGVLAPVLRRGDVVVFDNLGAHLAPGVAEAIERAGARVLRLPPYSPDLNPIEQMFSKFKGVLRRAGSRTRDRLHRAIGEALRQIRTRDILGWFEHAGLRATQT